MGFFRGLAESTQASDAPCRVIRLAAGIMGWTRLISSLDTQAASAWAAGKHHRRARQRSFAIAALDSGNLESTLHKDLQGSPTGPAALRYWYVRV